MEKILVIEDDSNIRENVVELLSAEGYTVIEAPDGIKGLQLIKAQNPDLILCDISMPGLSGYDVLNTIRSEGSHHSPFIFLTAKTSREDYRTGMESGADDYLTKPFTRTELLNAIKSRLKRGQLYEDKYIRLKSNVKYALPHEFLTPLSAILAASQIILEEEGKMETKQTYDFVRIINRSADTLKMTIDKYFFLIDLMMIKSDPDQIAQLKKEITPAANKTLQSTAESVARLLNRPEDLGIYAEDTDLAIKYEHFTRLVSELTENALKFSKKGDKVMVTGTVSGSDYILTVHNLGSSMSMEEIAATDEFVKFKKHIKERKGMGLGLGIVKNICGLINAGLVISSTEESVSVTCTFKRVN